MTLAEAGRELSTLVATANQITSNHTSADQGYLIIMKQIDGLIGSAWEAIESAITDSELDLALGRIQGKLESILLLVDDMATLEEKELLEPLLYSFNRSLKRITLGVI